jgi:hypothetical protein
MPKKTDLVKREDTSLVNPNDFLDFDPTDEEGYGDTPFRAMNFVKTDHDNEGIFVLKNTLSKETIETNELRMIVLAHYPYARVRFDGGGAVCKSMDSNHAFNPMNSEECGRCAPCEWRKYEDKQKRCQQKPIFIGDEIGIEDREGFGLIVFTLGSSAITPITNLNSLLEVEATKSGFSAKRLPLYWYILKITTKEVINPGQKAHYPPVFELERQMPSGKDPEEPEDGLTQLKYRELRKQYLELGDKETLVHEADDTKVETEVKEKAGRTFYDPNDTSPE